MDNDTISRQVEAIARWLSVFHPPESGEVVELRALNVPGKKAACETFSDNATLARRAGVLDGAGASGCYFTLNPLRPDLAGWTDSQESEVQGAFVQFIVAAGVFNG